MAAPEHGAGFDGGAPWAGLWRVEGRMPGGGGYAGTIECRVRGGGYVLKWDIDDGVYFGSGAVSTGRFFVSCSPFERGLVLAIRGADAATLWRESRPQRGFAALPQGEGFGVGAIIIDGVAVEAQHFGGVAAAYGADLARHALLVYEADGPDRLQSRWILGRDMAEGTERLERLSPPE